MRWPRWRSTTCVKTKSPASSNLPRLKAATYRLINFRAVRDKAPGEVKCFASLAAEAAENGAEWQVVFAAGLSGRGQTAPSDVEIAHALEVMVESVRQGSFGRYAAYNISGEPLGFS